MLNANLVLVTIRSFFSLLGPKLARRLLTLLLFKWNQATADCYLLSLKQRRETISSSSSSNYHNSLLFLNLNWKGNEHEESWLRRHFPSRRMLAMKRSLVDELHNEALTRGTLSFVPWWWWMNRWMMCSAGHYVTFPRRSFSFRVF